MLRVKALLWNIHGHPSQQFQVIVSQIITWEQHCCCSALLGKSSTKPKGGSMCPLWLHAKEHSPAFEGTGPTPAVSGQFLGFYTHCTFQVFCDF